ncbi:TPA: hypothetical protein OL467_001907 [Clostridioides difficile]|nr:hypothetical protein [Clostridioides difficile]
MQIILVVIFSAGLPKRWSCFKILIFWILPLLTSTDTVAFTNLLSALPV